MTSPLSYSERKEKRRENEKKRGQLNFVFFVYLKEINK